MTYPDGKDFRERELVKKRCTNTIRKILALHPKERDFIIAELLISTSKKNAMNKSTTVSVLFARADSIYKALVVDVWDIERDARKYSGPNPVITHPPCRAWGNLSHFAKPRPDEKQLAVFSINEVRTFGGVLEHPYMSKLWPYCKLPAPGTTDKWGGYTLVVNQSWWGHRAEKKTKLYIVGCPINKLPFIPISGHEPKYVVTSTSLGKPEIPKAEREKTPYLFAKWLIEVANRCKPPAKNVNSL